MVSGSSRARRCIVGVVVLGVIVLGIAATTSCGRATPPSPVSGAPITTAPTAPAPVTAPVVPDGDFTAVTQLVEDAIAAPRMPGAVVQVGHSGKIVFRQAFGARKLVGEPGLDGAPAPAEPMTEDTIFDLASMTKSLATATAVLQLAEQGKVAIDDPLQTYLP